MPIKNLQLLVLFAVISLGSASVSWGQYGYFEKIFLERTPGWAPSIQFDTSNGSRYQLTAYDQDGFKLEGPLGGVAVFRPLAPSASFVVGMDGIGIGNYVPEAALHVLGSDSSYGFNDARVVIENDKSVTSIRSMVDLYNNGGSRMVFNNTNTGEAWAMMTNDADNFIVSRGGSGGAELTLRKDGALFVGPGNNANFKLMPNGNLTISGSLNQQSDRNVKRAFMNVDPDEILAQVKKLPISTWQYKDDPAEVRHIGPMAQDFYSAFGLGENETTIATVDASGVALASIKALQSKYERLNESVNEKDAEIQRLQRELELQSFKSLAMEERMMAIETALLPAKLN